MQTVENKPISEWIIAVGKHEGFISSEHWIETQELLDAIAEKYNRPHRKTNALLAGLIHCPCCGKRLNVISESDRWTNGKPRFKYVCPGYRKKTCNFKAVDGVLLDEFIVQQLSDMSDEDSERFKEDDERFCHIFIKGCTDEDYTGFFQTAGYIEQKTTPVCDSEQYCICAEVSPEGILSGKTSGDRKNIAGTV